MQHYALSQPSASGGTSSAISATIPTTHLQFAHGFAHNQVVLGAGARLVSMSVREPQQNRAVFSSSGTGLEFGAVYKPENVPLRLGAAFRTAIRTQASYQDSLLPDQNGDLILTGSDGAPLFLPKAVAFPWDLNFGFAVQFGPRPLNPPWRTSSELIERQTVAHRLREIDRESTRKSAVRGAKTQAEREELERTFAREQRDDDRALDGALENARGLIESDLTKMNRFYVQIAGAMLISGPVEEALGVESLVTQTVSRSGQHTVASPRLGVESGVIPEFLKLRAGTYLEPTRFEGSEVRPHVTFGFDVKLIKWNVFGAWPDDYMWRLGVGADAARQYNTWGLTLAGWYPRHVQKSEVQSSARLP
jgi:hypothetical protein